MAISVLEPFCDKLNEEFDKIFDTVDKAKETIKPLLDLLRTKLATKPFNDIVDYERMKDEINNAIDTIVPPVEEFDELATLIQTCPYLANNPLLSNAANFVKSFGPNMKRIASDAIQALDTLVNWEIAIQLVGLEDLYKKYGFDIAFPELQNILLCLEGICGVDTASKVSKLTQLKQLLSIGSDGNFDPIAFLQDPATGLTPDEIATVQLQLDTYKSVMNRVDDIINTAANQFKTLGLS